MIQEDMFMALDVPVLRLDKPAHKLRHYQEEAVDAIFGAWEDSPSALIVMATGLGKTQVFCEVAKRSEGRVLVLAHRDELVQQAITRLEQATGELVGLEQAQFRSGLERIVVGSVQTVYRDDRIQRLARNGGFKTVIVDEAHHYVARTYKKAVDAWEGARILGVTATPDRADEKALGRLFDTVAFELDIADGIDMGYLVPVEGRQVFLEEIDLTDVSSSSGDLAKGQLDEAMLKAVEGIVQTTLERWGDRCGPAFFPGKKSAEYANERFNRLKPGSSALLTDDTPHDERREITRACKRGDIQYLCNCMIATEGFDWPHADLMVGGRPTKSRALFTQMVGRTTRTAPGTVDHIPGAEGAPARRAAIAESSKPMAIVADFVGNSGKHSLASVEDALGGRYTEEEVAKAKELAKADEGGDPRSNLDEARKMLQAIAAKAKARVKSKVTVFDMFSIGPSDQDLRYGAKPPSAKQLDALTKFGVTEDELQGLSRSQATKLMGTLILRRQHGLASLKQTKLLQKYGVTNVNISFAAARAAIDYLAKNQWGKGPNYDPAQLRIVAAGGR